MAPPKAWCKPCRGATILCRAPAAAEATIDRKPKDRSHAHECRRTKDTARHWARILRYPHVRCAAGTLVEMLHRAAAHERVVGPEGLHHRRVKNGFACRRNLSRRHAKS